MAWRCKALYSFDFWRIMHAVKAKKRIRCFYIDWNLCLPIETTIEICGKDHAVDERGVLRALSDLYAIDDFTTAMDLHDRFLTMCDGFDNLRKLQL